MDHANGLISKVILNIYRKNLIFFYYEEFMFIFIKGTKSDKKT